MPGFRMAGSNGFREAVQGLPDQLMGNLESAGITHQSPVLNTINGLRGGQVSGRDETGSVRFGRNGISVSKKDPNASPMSSNGTRGNELWGLSINPASRSGSFHTGDLEIGGTFMPGNMQGYVSKGGITLSGGNGYAPVPAVVGQGFGAAAKPGAWAQVSFQAGNPNQIKETADQRGDYTPSARQNLGESFTPMAQISAGQAVAPFLQPAPQTAPTEASPRELINGMIDKYRANNPNWMHP